MPADPRPTRSAAWRGALWITLIALITTSLALTLQYVQTTRTVEARRHAVLDDETSALIERYRNEGIGGVVQAIQRQQNVPRIHEFFYLLTLPDGTPLAGNLVAWPAEVAHAGFHSFETDVTNTRNVSKRRWVEVRAVTLDGGFRLLVGDFADERVVLRERYFSALIFSLLATGVLGMLLGWWYSRRGLTFVRLVSNAGDRFLSGQLGERLPVSRRGDEYDRLAETINRTFAEVERLIGSLRASTDGMAHDLKTPLTRIRARLELAEMGAAGEPWSGIEESRRDMDGLLRLIDDMLSLARAESLPTDSFVPIALDSIVQEALELYEPVAQEKRITLKAAVEPAMVLGSRSLLGRLVANLVDNAVKYVQPGGRVDVSLGERGEDVLLAVADNGLGIDPAKRQEVIGRFRRLDESRATEGSGLGLSIVEAVARAHKATLALIDNAPGLKVEVRFPRSTEDRRAVP